MNFLETYLELDKLQEWKLMTKPTQSTAPAQSAIKAGPKNYQVTYYEDGVKKSFTLTADSTAEAEQIAWSRVEADSLYVSELEEELNTLDEGNKVIDRFNKPYYSGSFSSLNGISTRPTPKSPEQIAQEEEERKKQEKEDKIEYAIYGTSVNTYHYRHQQEILSDPEWPALDPKTRERVYDPARKKDLVMQSVEYKKQEFQQAAQKAAETRAAKQAEKARSYHWVATYTINKEIFNIGKNVIGNEDPEAMRKLMKQTAVKRIKQEMHECKVFGERFDWDGKITITCTPPKESGEAKIEYIETFEKRKAV